MNVSISEETSYTDHVVQFNTFNNSERKMGLSVFHTAKSKLRQMKIFAKYVFTEKNI